MSTPSSTRPARSSWALIVMALAELGREDLQRRSAAEMQRVFDDGKPSQPSGSDIDKPACQATGVQK